MAFAAAAFRKHTLSTILATVAILVAAFALAAPAEAAFPGANGKLVFSRGLEVYTINSDGSALTQLTSSAPSLPDPAWSPDGQKIALRFCSTPQCYDYEKNLYTMNADGTGATQITNWTFDCGSDPTWSPDGQTIAFINKSLCVPVGGPRSDEIYTIKLDGSGLTRVTSDDVDERWPTWSPDGQKIAYGSNTEIYTIKPDGTDRTRLTNDSYTDWSPSWSPDGSRIAFSSTRDEQSNVRPAIYSMKPDGTDVTSITRGPTSYDYQPAWSPDGRKIAFTSCRDRVRDCGTDIYVVNADGTEIVPVTGTAGSRSQTPDWQPLPGSYPRPNGAAKTRVTLVPALEPCTAPNTTHGPPLELASCNPAVQRSSELLTTNDDTTRANGSVTFRYVCVNGGTPVDCGGSGDEADVRIQLSLNDVRCRPLPARSLLTACGSSNDTPGEDYKGEVLVVVQLRITDRYNGATLSDSATTTDYDFSWGVPCTETDPTIGSGCPVITTADSILGGVANENQRAIWQLGQFSVMDMGPDAKLAENPVGYTTCPPACVGTGDESPYAVQGIFIP